ncbi:MAG: hypothetical protein IIA67_00105 [Planctomycetes bacterium]|nr:hypothetical protein [Planctomycetota bacterium]
MGASAVAPALLALAPFLVIYILGRVRENREGGPDGTLGPRIFLTLMMSVAFHIVLIGITMALAEQFKFDRRVMNPSDRYATALGMILGGGLAGAYPTAVYLLRYTRPSPAGVFRAALGINAIYTGIVFSVAITATTVSLLNEGSQINSLLATTCTYFSANLLCAAPLLADRRKSISTTRPPYQPPSS